MKIYTFPLGPLKTNCYIVTNEARGFIIDPGYESRELEEFIDSKNINIEGILLTHCHFDHCGGVRSLKEKYKVNIYISEADFEGLGDPSYNGSALMQRAESFKEEGSIFVKEGENISLAGLEIEVIFTPGHTKGGVCYKLEDIIFCGDTLFFHSIGRTDFPGGDHALLEKSIRNKIYTLDENITLLTGHGLKTTILEEKNNNSFFRA